MTATSNTIKMIAAARTDMDRSIAAAGRRLESFLAPIEGGRDPMLDQFADYAIRQGGHDGRKVECRVGCAHCCHQLVLASPLEVLRIARTIKATWSEAEKRALIERLERLAVVEPSSRPRHNRNLPCPLLSDNRCLVYSDRPASCRAFLSFSAGACAASLDAHTEGRDDAPMVESPYAINEAATFTAVGYDAAQIARNLDTERVDLVLVATRIGS